MIKKASIILVIATQTWGFVPLNPVKIKPTTITPSNPLSPPCSRGQSDKQDGALFVVDIPESTLIGDDSAEFSLQGQVSR